MLLSQAEISCKETCKLPCGSFFVLKLRELASLRRKFCSKPFTRCYFIKIPQYSFKILSCVFLHYVHSLLSCFAPSGLSRTSVWPHIQCWRSLNGPVDTVSRDRSSRLVVNTGWVSISPFWCTFWGIAAEKAHGNAKNPGKKKNLIWKKKKKHLKELHTKFSLIRRQ